MLAEGVDKNGKPHKVRLYSIASSAIGDFGDSKTVRFFTLILCSWSNLVFLIALVNEVGQIAGFSVREEGSLHKWSRGVSQRSVL